jgi:hypothetical protein
MSLSDLSSLGSFIGGIAVVASVIYLALQIRQNTKSVRAQNAIAHFEMTARRTEFLARDPQILAVSERAARGDTSLNEIEFLQFAFATQVAVTVLYTDWLLDQERLLHGGTFSSSQWLQNRLVWTRPGNRAWWKTYGGQFAPGFVTEMNRALEKTRPGPGDLGFAEWKIHLSQELAAMASNAE